MQLSVLDQSIASHGRPQSAAIRESLALAQWCEKLGYHRYWVSEHHNSDAIVGSAPEVLMAAIAATTERIRVGSAGVMLPHYSSLKVAEQFRVLEGIAPGRIDLGLGRAPGSDRLTALALNPDAAHAHKAFPQQVIELRQWVRGEALQSDHPFGKISAHPQGETAPQMWMLGRSDYGAQLGAHLGMPYAFAYFALYRSNFRAVDKLNAAHSAVCVWVLVADTEEEALHHYRSRAHWRIGFEKCLREPLAAPESLVDVEYHPAEQSRIEHMRRAAFIGTAPNVAQRLRELVQRLQLDELVVVTWTHDPAARHRSYELLAQEMFDK